MSYAAKISTWLEPWGPVGWVAIGGIAAVVLLLFVMCCYWIYAKSRSYLRSSAFVDRVVGTYSINPLNDHFTRERINLGAFYNPFFQQIDNVKFQDCELLGPAYIWPVGGVFDRSPLFDCDIVILRPGARSFTITKMVNCTFERCKFHRVTLCLAYDQYINWKSQFSAGSFTLNVITIDEMSAKSPLAEAKVDQ